MWKYKALSEVCNYVNEKVSISKINLDNYISTENMLAEKGGITRASNLPDVDRVTAYKENDILTSNIRPYFKKIWYAKNSGGCSNDVLVFRANKSLLPKFLYYVLSENNFFNYATTSSKGTKMPRGSKDAIMKYLIPDIELPTQQKIADILSAYDDLIENNNRRIELLEQAAQHIYKEWFVRFRFPGYEKVHFTKGLPDGWEVKKLSDFVEIIDGDRGTNYPNQNELFDEGYCLFLNAGNVTVNGFDFSKNTFITKEKDEKLRKGKLIRNDIVITTRGTVGNIALYNSFVPYDDLRINSGMVIIRPLSSVVNTSFLYLLLRSNSVQQLFSLFASGSAQPQLPIKDMKNIKLLLPTKDLIDKFEEIIKPILEIISNKAAKNQNFIKQRDLMLPRLMSGKLEVQDGK